MAAVIKVEPETDSDSEPLSPQVTTELTDPIEERRSSQFTFVPVNAHIKVSHFTTLSTCFIMSNSDSVNMDPDVKVVLEITQRLFNSHRMLVNYNKTKFM
jgi:hypothetical protein